MHVSYMVMIWQEHELSADLITFHQAVSQLQIMEDELLECHARVTDESEKWLELDRRFLTHTAEVDYDQEGRNFSQGRPIENIDLNVNIYDEFLQ
jgi:hypothetical protein